MALSAPILARETNPTRLSERHASLMRFLAPFAAQGMTV